VGHRKDDGSRDYRPDEHGHQYRPNDAVTSAADLAVTSAVTPAVTPAAAPAALRGAELGVERPRARVRVVHEGESGRSSGGLLGPLGAGRRRGVCCCCRRREVPALAVGVAVALAVAVEKDLAAEEGGKITIARLGGVLEGCHGN